MADQTHPDQTQPDRGLRWVGLRVPASKLLIGVFGAAVTATLALLVAYVSLVSTPPPVARGPGAPPPPIRVESLGTVIVLTGVFVLVWLAVIVVAARDRVLRQLQDLTFSVGSDADAVGPEVRQLLAALRGDLVADHRAGLAGLEERLAALTSEYGEQRETDGYISGMRVATTVGQERAEVRQIRPVRPLP